MEQQIRTDGFEIWVHKDVYTFLNNHPTLNNKVYLTFDSLKIKAPTPQTKTTQGVNGLWSRDGIGGNGGNQWYLWWTFKGPSIQATGETLRPLFIRAIRDHDNHSKLYKDDDIAQYTKFTHDNLLNSDSPPSLYLHEQQQAFIRSSAQIRTLRGNPGSGKTLTLHQSVSRLNKKVLYITWSQALAEKAQEYFTAFKRQDTKVDVVYFRQFLKVITDVGIPSFSLEAAVKHFKTQRTEMALGPWKDNDTLLLLELRAHKFARMPRIDEVLDSTKQCSINNSEYNAIEREQILGQRAVTIAKRYSQKDRLNGEELFPDLQGALIALRSLEMGNGLDNYRDYNAIVVDEIQDLTILEQKVIVTLARCIGDQPSGLQPTVWFAGDEGQTVNGSEFRWPATNYLLSELKYGSVEEFQLESSPRFPNNIAEVLERLRNEQTEHIDKPLRPRGQKEVIGNTEKKETDIWHVTIGTPEEGKDLIEQILELGGERVAVIIPRERQSEVKDQIGNVKGVQTPVEVKGLEYQISCVVNMGRELDAVSQAQNSLTNRHELERNFSRYRYDRLRVAISRATETLIVLDIEATDDEVSRSRELLGVASRSKEDLLSFLKEHNLDPDGRLRSILGGIDQIYGSPEAVHQLSAWDKVRKSLELLSDRDHHYAESDDSLRIETVDKAGKVALWLIAADTLHNDLKIDEIRETILRELRNDGRTVGRGLEGKVFSAFCEWVADPVASPFEFLRCVENFVDIPKWIESGISNKQLKIRQCIIEGSTNREQCLFYDGNISSWIHISGLNTTPRELLKNVLKTLLDNNINDKLRGVLDKILPLDGGEEWILAGRVEYELEFYAEAAEWYEKAEEWVCAEDARLKANQWDLALLNALRIPARKDQWLEKLKRVREFVEEMSFDGSQRTSADLDNLQRVREFVEKMSFDGSQHTRPR